jgi:hypothetical protein
VVLATDLRRIVMERALIIKDLPVTAEEATLAPEKMKLLRGGRAVQVTVDGQRPGTVDDWQMNIAIFEGRINGPYIV